MSNGQRNGRSIAIWGESKEPKGQLHAHFNYWHLASHKTSIKSEGDFFDIGVRCVAPKYPSGLYIYLPLEVALETIEDLGPLFKDKELAAGIFNESLSVTEGPNNHHIDLARASKPFARVFVFDAPKGSISEKQLRVTPEAEGTLLEITADALKDGSKGLDENDALYFRIRVRLTSKENPFSRVIKPADTFLLSSFEDTEFLDFRLNEARNLPDSIANRKWPDGSIDQLATIPISQIHFLVVVGEAASVTGGIGTDKQRLLESKLWDRYTKPKSSSEKHLCDDMVVHHWTKKSKNENEITDIGAFSAFMKLRIRRSGRSLVLRYLFVVALIGCIGSLLGSVIWTRFDLEQIVSSMPPAPPLTTEVIEKVCAQAMFAKCTKESQGGLSNTSNVNIYGKATGEKQ